jgi:hypothetical protein
VHKPTGMPRPGRDGHAEASDARGALTFVSHSDTHSSLSVHITTSASNSVPANDIHAMSAFPECASASASAICAMSASPECAPHANSCLHSANSHSMSASPVLDNSHHIPVLCLCLHSQVAMIKSVQTQVCRPDPAGIMSGVNP